MVQIPRGGVRPMDGIRHAIRSRDAWLYWSTIGVFAALWLILLSACLAPVHGTEQPPLSGLVTMLVYFPCNGTPISLPAAG